MGNDSYYETNTDEIIDALWAIKKELRRLADKIAGADD